MAFPVDKDLVADTDAFLARLEAIGPSLVPAEPPADVEYARSVEDRAVIDDAVNGILCGWCAGSCPAFWYNKEDLGPAALLKGFRFAFDSRDGATAQRLDPVDDHNEPWRCHTIFHCSECCPKTLNITGAIQELEKRVVPAEERMAGTATDRRMLARMLPLGRAASVFSVRLARGGDLHPYDIPPGRSHRR